MMEFGSTLTDRNLMISAQFLHEELPIRIARRATELHSLPYGLSNKPAVLKRLRIRMMNWSSHNNVVPTMAFGVQQLKKDLHDQEDLDEIHQFLDRFYMSRDWHSNASSLGQHVKLHNPNPPPS